VGETEMAQQTWYQEACPNSGAEAWQGQESAGSISGLPLFQSSQEAQESNA